MKSLKKIASMLGEVRGQQPEVIIDTIAAVFVVALFEVFGALASMLAKHSPSGSVLFVLGTLTVAGMTVFHMAMAPIHYEDQ